MLEAVERTIHHSIGFNTKLLFTNYFYILNYNSSISANAIFSFIYLKSVQLFIFSLLSNRVFFDRNHFSGIVIDLDKFSNISPII